MVTATSATGGFIAPIPPLPLEDAGLEDFFQAIIRGLTGLSGKFIFPRWQKEPPNLPPVGADWAAFGITNVTPDTYAVEQHVDDGQGLDELQRHETITMLVSFYGPNGGKYAGLFRNGLQIATNRDVLTRAGMGMVDTGEVVTAPAFVKEQWLQRKDVRWTVRRAVQQFYPVLSLLSVHGGLIAADTVSGNKTREVSINVSEPQ